MLVGVLQSALFISGGENHTSLIVIIISGMYKELPKDSKQKNSADCHAESNPIPAKCTGENPQTTLPSF